MSEKAQKTHLKKVYSEPLGMKVHEELPVEEQPEENPWYLFLVSPALFTRWLQVNTVNHIMLYPSFPISLHVVESALIFPHIKFVNTLW